MKSSAVLFLYVTVSGVYMFPPSTPAQNLQTTTLQKRDQQNTSDVKENWNRGLKDFDKLYPNPFERKFHKVEPFIFRQKSFNEKIFLKDLAMMRSKTSPPSSTNVEIQVETMEGRKNSSAGNETSTASTFGFHNLVDVQDNGCQPGFARDPIGKCQKIEN